jgi:quercetin dioxygenase-like cupin family protein
MNSEAIRYFRLAGISPRLRVAVAEILRSRPTRNQEPAKFQDRQLRLRKLVIEPGGVVPWHSHGDRPAIIYIIEGEILEYASTCAVPIVHKAGDVARETHTTSHWWKNTSTKTVVLLSADILHDKSDKNM